MDWWDNTWLIEGFATYMAVKSVTAAEPDWQLLDQFLSGTLHSILALDATRASHPVVKNVQRPDQITEGFDPVSFNKVRLTSTATFSIDTRLGSFHIENVRIGGQIR
jgi:glutamyl aminopeptidase